MIGLKYNMSLPMAAGALLVVLPYSVSLVAQWMYGWPNKPGYKKYIEALKPRRIYCLTRAVLEMLKYFQYGKLYFQWKSWYKNAENHKHYEKGITFGRRSNKLDLYYSPMVSQSARLATASQSGSGPIPVVVFIYGGAWGSGERSIYCLLAMQMAKELNATVICPDYCTYPKGNVLCMVQDIADCLVWARESSQKFNLDKDNIVLVGHSAGAHLAALTVLFMVEGRDELFIEANKQTEIAAAIKGVTGLSGVYNIIDHYEHEQMRGVEYVSTMHKAMNGVENFPYYSPTHLLKKFSEEQLKRVPPFSLIHGTNDIIVPVSSSQRFSELLNSLSIKVSLYLMPKMDHTEIVTDLMATNRHFYNTVFSCIKQDYSKYIGQVCDS
ncbi:probable isoprenylcysteine alpha-carbonyl methylesterase ICMEL1 isoform X1 [Esox lucius]|uniref:probable isoprenylcysteine alpha-carbonyl methylesterase ICMEL1 isoform X1 n=1 Tax=Esox lucius TaxID=8010 RepID=UPI00097340D0|nr:probable isoprenylcysteine alpha-carbonyl methylesterase ICMEL1 isoform X1 [Esox lucius]XP_019907823.1 probable isoprenylcysteine alpha-carbonyl methylesterase ICMEL1 isoform X1 [Esox lucius]XP_019907824.1 probable isoprenylcysteine alpha-carbonyl methylesterase ICMEL1 isoform X1 [Esox lucius]XP_019907825.1 probable isoprenylcysteine alpha-carbonyl methylesterase ICMEL1 isoform X1 [Esox lucius]